MTRKTRKNQYKLLKNKIYATVIVLVGLVPTIVDGDFTAFIFCLILGLLLFFSNRNWIT